MDEYKRELNRERGRRWRAKNPEANRNRMRTWRKENAEENRARQRRYYEQSRKRQQAYRYGMTPEQWDALFAAQGNACAVCKAATPGGKHDWHTDHDHQTGTVRGILCTLCNTGIGMFQDDPSRCRAAAAYLEPWL